MKRILAIVLFFCLLLPVLGVFLWLQYEKQIVRKEVKQMIIAGLAKDELVFFKFSLEDAKVKLSWEHSKEFEYMDNMYDVVETEIQNDSVSYWCWLDSKESELNLKLEHLVSNALGQNPQTRENHSRYFNFLKSMYPQMVFDWKSGTLNITEEILSPYSLDYTSLTISPLSPPPKIG